MSYAAVVVDKPPRRTSPSRSESQAPLFTNESSPTESLRQPLSKEEKQQLRKQARTHYEKDWLVPAGSVEEKQFLRGWAKQEGSPELRDLIYKWIDDPNEVAKWIENPDKFAKRNELFWQGAKKSVLGPVVYERAIERHRTLDDREWLVAYFTAQCKEQKEIAKLIHLGDKTVDNIVRSLKNKITQELECDVEIDDRVQIARWFLGM